MTKTLNTGTGRCDCTASLSIRPTPSALSMGACGDVVSGVLVAVHHFNRHADIDDFIAVALPNMRPGRDRMLPGEEVEIIGSEKGLESFLELDGVEQMVRRRLVADLEIFPVEREPGERGAAFIRDRSADKRSAGWERRMLERAKRRGKVPSKTGNRDSSHRRDLPLFYGKATILVRQIVGFMTDEPLTVSTYGYSSASTPAFLPVRSRMVTQAEAREDAA